MPQPQVKERGVSFSAPPANERSNRILDAASLCFSQRGFQSTTIVDVAQAAGVSRPLIYKYFRDKDGLIDSVLRSTFAEWESLNAPGAVGLPGPTRPAEKSDDGNASDALERRFQSALDFVRARPIFREILQQDPQIVLRGHLEGLRRCRAVSVASTRAILKSGRERGEFRADLDLDETTASVEMILFALLERTLGLRPELELDPSLLRSTLSLLQAGLATDRSV
jgi:AcrR family transcriptional regulator